MTFDRIDLLAPGDARLIFTVPGGETDRPLPEGQRPPATAVAIALDLDAGELTATLEDGSSEVIALSAADIAAVAAAPVVEPPVVPTSVRKIQFALQCLAMGIDIDALLAAIPEETERKVAQARWSGATVIFRADPLVLMLAAALEMTEADLDTAFIAAATLDPIPS
ncbi:hypothetical protein H5P28_00375 [Ruficoccus amylovorans]|uniref:Uncharacterized protein n=1 Tax=Ruficoccus amylovorans TaxID=1804625 RepID=A0A842HAP5_9BACT|nr:hypothetical protein [Ruficoccus amylovorans]MBC2592707.1 hypothetical protein [Ruficoccus amylovorans]